MAVAEGLLLGQSEYLACAGYRLSWPTGIYDKDFRFRNYRSLGCSCDKHHGTRLDFGVKAV